MTTTTKRDQAAMTEVTDNVAAFLLDSTTCSTLRDFIVPYFGDYAADFNLGAIEADYRAAITECLPEGVVLAGKFIFRRMDTNPDWDEIREQVQGIDFEAIVERHHVGAGRDEIQQPAWNLSAITERRDIGQPEACPAWCQRHWDTDGVTSHHARVTDGRWFVELERIQGIDWVLPPQVQDVISPAEALQLAALITKAVDLLGPDHRDQASRIGQWVLDAADQLGEGADR